MARKLTMKFAGRMIQHLGLRMYGGAVPAIVELVSNAWDADAENVRIDIPFGKSLKPHDTIVVTDDGCGMSYEDCRDKYMILGRDRREDEKTTTSPSGRPLMARKGIGKLAGFGIASEVTVETVHEGKKTSFTMDLQDIESLNRGQDYEIDHVMESDTDEDDGTKIILTNLTITRAIPKDSFLRSMARRFSILSNQFVVHINDEMLTREKERFEFRYPPNRSKDEFNTAEIDIPKGKQQIKWWVGFKRETIKHPEMQGVSVIVRGKMAQKPWPFDLAGGQWGQFGITYMTGEVFADYLDSGDKDLIASDRSEILWEHPDAAPLKEYMAKQIRQCLTDWAKKRAAKRIKRAKKQNPRMKKRLERYSEREQTQITTALETISKVETIKDEEVDNLLNAVMDAFDDSAFRSVLEDLKKDDPPTLKRVLEILSEFRVLEALKLGRLVWGRLTVLKQLEDLIARNAGERDELHVLLKDQPWILGPDYDDQVHDKQLASTLAKKFGLKIEDRHGTKRPDILVTRGAREVVIIELKRPDVYVGWEELEQIEKYVRFMRTYLSGVEDKRIVSGFLISGGIVNTEPMVMDKLEMLKKDGIQECPWTELLAKTRREHDHFLKVIKSRAPEDSRIEELVSDVELVQEKIPT